MVRVDMEHFLDHMPRTMIDDMGHHRIRSPGQMFRDWHSLLACWRQGYRAKLMAGHDEKPRIQMDLIYCY